MAAKMADFMQKYVNSYNARYIEAILQILMAKLTLLNTAGTGLACLKQLDCFRTEINSISASRQDSKEIPTATPTFSWSSNSMALLRLLPDVKGSLHFKTES